MTQTRTHLKFQKWLNLSTTCKCWSCSVTVTFCISRSDDTFIFAQVLHLHRSTSIHCRWIFVTKPYFSRKSFNSQTQGSHRFVYDFGFVIWSLNSLRFNTFWKNFVHQGRHVIKWLPGSGGRKNWRCGICCGLYVWYILYMIYISQIAFDICIMYIWRWQYLFQEKRIMYVKIPKMNTLGLFSSAVLLFL